MTLKASDTALEATARRHLRCGRIREAETLVEAWCAQRPNSAAALVLQAWILLLGGRLEEGRQTLEAVSASAPHLASACVVRGMLHAAEGKLDDAQLCWQRALALDASDLDAVALLVQASIQAGDLAGAQRQAREGLLACPQEAAAHFILAEVLLRTAIAREKIVALVKAGLELDREDWRNWAVAGKVFAATGNWAEARSHFEHALKLRPMEPEVMHALAVVAISEARWEEVESLARKLIAVSPEQEGGHRLHARALFGQRRDAEAMAALTGAAKSNPALLIDVAKAHQRAGQLEEASAAALQAQAAGHPDAEPLLAALDLRRGRVAVAFERLAQLARAKIPEGCARLEADLSRASGHKLVLTADTAGQVLLLARFAHRLAAYGIEVWLDCPQVDFGASSFTLKGVQGIVPAAQCKDALMEPIVGLPARLEVAHPEDLWDGAYLEVNEADVALARELLEARPRPWIGIDLDLPDDIKAEMLGVVRDTGGTAIVLGRGIDVLALGDVGVKPRLSDLYTVAVWVQAADYVVTSDTLVPALAGALGKPAHVLLGLECDPIWGAAGGRTPWYPSLTLHRESRAMGWSGVADAVNTALTATS